MKDWNEISKDNKNELRGCLGLLVVFFICLFAFLYRDYEDKKLEKHGVWTILSITSKEKTSPGYKVYYVFQLSDRTYKGEVTMSDERIKSGNRFFVLADPNNLGKHKIGNIVPEYLEAPLEGWKKLPKGKELRDMAYQNYLNKTSGNKELSQNIKNQTQDTIENEDIQDKTSDKNNEVLKMSFGVLLMVSFFIFVFLYRKRVTRYIEEHGVWTIMTITRKDMSETLFHKKIHYTFQLDNQTYSGSVNLSGKKVKSGNRFFIMVVPDKEYRLRVYDAIPEWFTLDAPPKGWEMRPTENDLRVTMSQNNKERTSEEE